jgi:hypothetical protein
MTIGQPQAEPQDRLSKCLRGASFRDAGGSRNRKFRKTHCPFRKYRFDVWIVKAELPRRPRPRWREAASKDAPEDIGAAAGDVKERRFPPANLGIDSNACRPRKTRPPMATAPRPHEPRSGKTTLAQIVARGLGAASAPPQARFIQRAGDPRRNRNPRPAPFHPDRRHRSGGSPSRSVLHRQPR